MKPVIVVSGLPRSGTSMMMQILRAGGLEVVSDGLRGPDADNPKGYLELEAAKKLKEDHTWVADASGKVVKLISELLHQLPCDYRYQILFMRRKMQEVLDSQRQMLVRRGVEHGQVDDGTMAALFSDHLRKVEAWIEAQPHIEVCYVDYNRMIEEPADHIDHVNRFLGRSLRVDEMLQVVDSSLYRQRS